MKVVYNACYGGFGLSDKAIQLYNKKSGSVLAKYDYPERNDKYLVEVVEELGKLADGFCSKLRIKEIPDGASYEIDEYDGYESVVPPRSSW